MNAFRGIRAHSKLRQHPSEFEGLETHLSLIECYRAHPGQVEHNRVGQFEGRGTHLSAMSRFVSNQKIIPLQTHFQASKTRLQQ